MKNRVSSSASPSSFEAEPEARDYLTHLPPEILLTTVTQVPLKKFLDLVQSCRMLRNVVKINSSRICNEILRTRFPLEAAVLLSELGSERLVPTHCGIKEEELDLRIGL